MKLNGLRVPRQKVIVVTFFAGPGSGFFGDILQPQGSGGNNLFSNNMPQPMVATGGANGTVNADQVRSLKQFYSVSFR